MKTALLDVHVLIALAWPNHVHHARAHAWFAANQRHGWATCPTTQSGFVRVSSNHRITPEARTPREAIHLLGEIVALPGHTFWADDTAIATSKFIAIERLVGHTQVTDAHLLALALRKRGRFVSFDQGVRSLMRNGPPDALVIISGTAE